MSTEVKATTNAEALALAHCNALWGEWAQWRFFKLGNKAAFNLPTSELYSTRDLWNEEDSFCYMEEQKSSKQKDSGKLNKKHTEKVFFLWVLCNQHAAEQLTLSTATTAAVHFQLSASFQPLCQLLSCSHEITDGGRAEIRIRNQTGFLVRDYFLTLTGDSNATECLTGTEECTFSIEENPLVIILVPQIWTSKDC